MLSVKAINNILNTDRSEDSKKKNLFSPNGSLKDFFFFSLLNSIISAHVKTALVPESAPFPLARPAVSLVTF